jgi:hypothetical protein
VPLPTETYDVLPATTRFFEVANARLGEREEDGGTFCSDTITGLGLLWLEGPSPEIRLRLLQAFAGLTDSGAAASTPLIVHTVPPLLFYILTK